MTAMKPPCSSLMRAMESSHHTEYYDYARYGLERMNAEEGQVVKSGYVSYHGVLTLEELMMDDPAEIYQRELDFQMDGMT